MLPVLSLPSVFYFLLSPLLSFPSLLFCPSVLSDTEDVQKCMPSVLSPAYLQGYLLLGKPDTQANYCSAVGTCDDSEDFSRGKPFKLRLDGSAGSKEEERGQSWGKGQQAQSCVKEELGGSGLGGGLGGAWRVSRLRRKPAQRTTDLECPAEVVR